MGFDIITSANGGVTWTERSKSGGVGILPYQHRLLGLGRAEHGYLRPGQDMDRPDEEVHIRRRQDLEDLPSHIFRCHQLCQCRRWLSDVEHRVHPVEKRGRWGHLGAL